MSPAERRITRRQALVGAAGGALALVAAGAGAVELIKAGDLPGKTVLDRLDGACDVASPPSTSEPPGPTFTGKFYSHARGREVGYAIAYPPGYSHGSKLPLALYLHGFGGHGNGASAKVWAFNLADRLGKYPLPAFAIACADGGNLYWHAHPGDDPMAMLLDELVPLCNQIGLGESGGKFGVIGESMGGYGALLLTERNPERVAAVAAISPAIFSSYAAAHSADPASFVSPADFSANNVVSGAAPLDQIPVRIASGQSDPFHPGVKKLAAALAGSSATILFPSGCHDEAFFATQRPQSAQFVGERLQALAV